MTRLKCDLGKPAPVPEQGLKRAAEVIRSGRLTRYGEFSGTGSEVAALEREFANYIGARYAVAVNSGGNAIYLALLCAGVQHGDSVLLNAFTLAPVPGAIANAGAKPLYVECTSDYTIDLADLEANAPHASVLLLSHMRGHMPNMDNVVRICRDHKITLIEDCAHTLGAYWDGTASGRFGAFGCYSLQAYKHINAGEGGILVTDDEDAAARAILYSGSYMLYEQHEARPSPEVFERHNRSTPNFSLRMSEVTAAIARPQISLLNERGANWTRGYRHVADALSTLQHVSLPERDDREQFIGSSLQFSLIGLNAEQIEQVLLLCEARGLSLKWFGRDRPLGFTSQWTHWRYVEDVPELHRTKAMLAGLCDLRIPLDLRQEDGQAIGHIIRDAIQATL